VDGANGIASNLPFNTITLFAFAPEADTDLGRYDDWLRLLIYHELLHILHIDQMELGARWVNNVVGKTLAPNNALPLWFLEGFATWVESRYTGGGRVGSAAYEQYLRVAALEGSLPSSLSGLGGALLAPPGGSWPYVFGSDFIRFIAQRHGEDALVDFVERYGRRLLPYGLNNVARLSFGEDFPTMFKLWHKARVNDAIATTGALKKAGLRGGQRLTTGQLVMHGPAYSPDGRLSFVRTDGWTPTRRYIARLEEEGLVEEEILYECYGGCGRAEFTPDGRHIYSISARWPTPHVRFRDLVRFDVESPQTIGPNRVPDRVTKGLRAREPAIRPDGVEVTFVAARWGQTALVSVDLATGELTTRVPFDQCWQLNQPRYLEQTSAGWRLLVSAQRDGGWRDLFILEPDGQMKRLTSNPHREISPDISSDGQQIYFSSDRSGIWNVHRIDRRTGDEFQVTRVLGAAHLPTISPDDQRLVYVGYHGTGNDLYALELDTDQDERLRPDYRMPPPPYAPRPVTVKDREYEPWRASWPRQVEIEVTGDALQGAGSVTVSTFGNDAVRNHFWSALLNYQVGEDDVGIAARYTYSGLWPSFSVFLSRWSSEGVRFIADKTSGFPMENLYGAVSATLEIPSVLDSFTVGGEINLWGYFNSSRSGYAPKNDPGSSVPFMTEDGYQLGVRLHWSYRRIDSWPFSISPERGVHTGMSLSMYPTWFGNRDTSFTLSWFLNSYVPLYFARGHVLAFLYSGAVAGGDEEARTSFSLGGFPEQNIALDLINEGGVFGNYLRGYAPGQFGGDIYHLLTCEYRFPIVDPFIGLGTLPLWLSRLSGRIFSDVGLIWFDSFDSEDAIKASAGAELMLTTKLLYNLPTTFRLGYGAAVTRPFSHQFYFILGSNF
jgi:hypothetical protein